METYLDKALVKDFLSTCKEYIKELQGIRYHKKYNRKTFLFAVNCIDAFQNVTEQDFPGSYHLKERIVHLSLFILVRCYECKGK